MLKWIIKKINPTRRLDENNEEDCQELSSKSKPPITPEEAYREWITKSPPPQIANTTGKNNVTAGDK
jgi:hypothetical protein